MGLKTMLLEMSLFQMIVLIFQHVFDMILLGMQGCFIFVGLILVVVSSCLFFRRINKKNMILFLVYSLLVLINLVLKLT